MNRSSVQQDCWRTWGSWGKEPSCSLVFGTTGMGAGGLMGSDGKWSRLSNNAVEQKDALRFCS